MIHAEHLTDEQLDAVLRGEPAGTVAGHLIVCAECARKLVDQRSLDGLLAGSPELHEEHPHDAELLGLRDEALSPGRADELQAHLRRCGRCLAGFLRLRAEVATASSPVPPAHLVAEAMASFPSEASRSADSGTEEPAPEPLPWRSPVAPRPAVRPNLRAAVAAGVTALVLGYPAYRGLAPRPSSGADRGGLVTVGYLTATRTAGLRGARDDPWSDPERVPVIADGPALLILAIPFDATFLDEASPDERFEIRLVGVDGTVAWTVNVTAGEMRRRVATSADRAVSLQVPGEFVRPGDFELRVVPEAGGGEALLVAPVRIVRE